MTWKEFKKQVEDGGVTDEMEMWYIDVSSGTLIHDKVNVSPEDKEMNIIGFSVWT